MQPHRAALVSFSVALRQTTFLEGPAISGPAFSGPADFQRPRVSDGGAWRRLVELVVRAALARRRRCASAQPIHCPSHTAATALISNDTRQ